MSIDLEAIKARAEAATPGTWTVEPMTSKKARSGNNPRQFKITLGRVFENVALYLYKADADFIVHSREDIPALLAEVERQAAQLASVTAERDAMKERTRWVPVSEGLPNMCGFKCLVCAKNKFEQTHVFTAFTGYMEHWKLEFHSCESPYDDLSAWEITHWMPLPSAPDSEAANGN